MQNLFYAIAHNSYLTDYWADIQSHTSAFYYKGSNRFEIIRQGQARLKLIS